MKVAVPRTNENVGCTKEGIALKTIASSTVRILRRISFTRRS